jgi:hypothetical protein
MPETASENTFRAQPDRKLRTRQEYVDRRGCSLRTEERERNEGRGCPYVKLGSRIFYRDTDIDDYIEAHVRGGEPRKVATEPRRRGRPPKNPQARGAGVEA